MELLPRQVNLRSSSYTKNSMEISKANYYIYMGYLRPRHEVFLRWLGGGVGGSLLLDSNYEEANATKVLLVLWH